MSEFVLVFGLSADPIHIGHVETVTQAYQALSKLDIPVTRILLVPIYRRNPVGAEKSRLPATFTARYVMCALAAREIRQRLGLSPQAVSVSDLEARLARERRMPNYTAETLTLLKLRTAPNTGLLFLLSSELVAGEVPQFSRWYHPLAIARLALLAIVPRPGYEANRRFLSALHQRGAHVVMLEDVHTPAISSSEIRRRLRHGESVAALASQGLLTPLVARFLSRYPLYAPPPGKGKSTNGMRDGGGSHGPLPRCCGPISGDDGALNPWHR